MSGFTHRIATEADIPALVALMDRSITGPLAAFLTPAQIAASRKLMGIDSQLIADRTYVIVEADGVLAGCGGWSGRITEYGGDHTPGRVPAPLTPGVDAARMRAMYTAPGFVRRGVGRPRTRSQSPGPPFWTPPDAPLTRGRCRLGTLRPSAPDDPARRVAPAVLNRPR